MEIEDKLEQLLIECEVNPDFTAYDVHYLIQHFKERDYNQYSLIIIKQVLKQRKFDVPDVDITAYLLGWLGDSDFLSNVQETDSDSAIQLAILLFKLIMVLELEELREIEL